MATSSNRVSASLTVSFGQSASDSNGGIVLEIDDRDPGSGGLNKKGTDFKPGDKAIYLLYVSPNVTVNQHILSSGSRSSEGSGTRVLSGVDAEYLIFTDSDSATLKYPAAGAVTMEWLGKERTDEGTDAITTSLGADQQTITLNGKVAGVLKCSYSASYTAFGVKAPLDYPQVVIVVIGTRT